MPATSTVQAPQPPRNCNRAKRVSLCDGLEDLLEIQLILWIITRVWNRMPRPTLRSEVLSRLRKVISDGGIIVGAGAGAFSCSPP